MNDRNESTKDNENAPNESLVKDDIESDRGLMQKNVKKAYYKKKECKFCKQKLNQVDFKDYNQMRRYITEKGKILPRRINGNCAKHQRMINRAVKRARNIALLPFVNKY